MAAKYVYAFGGGAAEGDGSQKDLLGGKGAGLAEMSRLGIPVPPGFTITTEVCTLFQDHGGSYPEGLEERGGGAARPPRGADGPALRRSRQIRCWSRCAPAPPRSMPGMMDTILNLGLSDAIVAAWIARGVDERFVLDAYRRLLTMYGDVVLDVPHHDFEEILGAARKAPGRGQRRRADAPSRCAAWWRTSRRSSPSRGTPFPQEPHEQLWGAIGAVFAELEQPAGARVPPDRGDPEPAWGPPSTCRPWCSATAAPTARPASPSPATRRPASGGCTANT